MLMMRCLFGVVDDNAVISKENRKAYHDLYENFLHIVLICCTTIRLASGLWC